MAVIAASYFPFDKQYSGKNSRAAPHGVWRNVFSLRAALIELVRELIGFGLSWVSSHDPLFCQGGYKWNCCERMLLQGLGSKMLRPNYSPVVAIRTGQ